MVYVGHILVCIMYMIIFYALGMLSDTLLYYVISDRAKKVAIALSSMFFLIGYGVSIYVLIYIIYNILG